MNDWRLTNQMDYLYQKKLKKSNLLDFPDKDHEHCAFCWEKIGKGEDMIHEGYTDEDAYHWVCNDCFNDFKDTFKWEV